MIRHPNLSARRESPAWAAAFCLFIAALGALPHLLFLHEWGSPSAFISAYDESTYLLGDISVQYRLLSDGFLGVGDLVAPSLQALVLASDVLLPAAAALAAWLVGARLFRDPGMRFLTALLLLFGQELFSFANTVVWSSFDISDLRLAAPPATLELIPDAGTSYMSLFRTPEPQISWVILFGFLALVAGPDPWRAFSGRLFWVTLLISACLPIIYPFVGVPIALLCVVLLVASRFHKPEVTYRIIAALGTSALVYVLAEVAHGGGGSSGLESDPSSLFSSHLPIATPAILAGALASAGMLVAFKSDVLRRVELLIPWAALSLPILLSNQQVVTGMMVSTRDWERNVNYPLVVFGLTSLVAIAARRRAAGTSPSRWARRVVWAAVVALAVQLVLWQEEVYDIWRPTNVEAHQTEDMLESLPSHLSGLPIVIEDVSVVPQVRLLTDDRFDIVLDYSRLFVDPIPPFSDAEGGSAAQVRNQRRMFEYWFRLGATPIGVESLLSRELAETDYTASIYSHFSFPLQDVWPPFSDWRALRREQALAGLPAVTIASTEFFADAAQQGLPAAVVITENTLGEPADGRSNELLASISDPSGTRPPLRMYLQRFTQYRGPHAPSSADELRTSVPRERKATTSR